MVPLPDCAAVRVAERARRAVRALDWEKEGMLIVLCTDGDWMSNIYRRSEMEKSCQVSDLECFFQKEWLCQREERLDWESFMHKQRTDGHYLTKKRYSEASVLLETMKRKQEKGKKKDARAST